MQTSTGGLVCFAAALAHSVDLIVRVDNYRRIMVGDVVGEFVRKLNVHKSRNGTDTPAGEEAQKVVHSVMRKYRNSVTDADAEVMQHAGVSIHRYHGFRVCH